MVDQDFRSLKSQRWLPTKVSSLEQAISAIHDGDILALGGMTLHRRPVAACVEIIRQQRRGLKLVDYCASYASDLLVGAGAVSTTQSCYFGMDVLGLAPMYRQMVANGEVRVIEETEATLAYGLRAARARVDFIPARIWSETDLPGSRPDLKRVESPYSGESYIAVPAIVPDVAIVHATIADASGNAVLGGNHSVDADIAAVAHTTIVTAERVTSTAEIEEHGADIIGGWVDHVVDASDGARPTSCFPLYDVDFLFLADYVDACGEGSFKEFVKRRVL
jgi:glutaconate CoA-transferase subunit A